MTTEKHPHVGRFYGVYLLCSESKEKRYKGKCYIGFTVNPNRRIKQHNRGKDFGGAHKTNNKGPWKMVMIVHGFPNNIAALQFEWAWQQPMLSSRLKIFEELKRKKPKETYFEYNFRILSRMLNVGPWCRLPLNVRWLELAYKRDFDYDLLPPRHMRIISGAIVLEKRKTRDAAGLARAMLWAKECHLCMQSISNPERSRMGCLNPTCKLTCHIICLSNHFIASDLRNRGHFVPVAGECPLCEMELTWVELLQYKSKMQGALCDDEAYAEDEEIELDVDSEMSTDALSSDDNNDELNVPKTTDYCKLSMQKHDESLEILELSD